MRRGTTLLALLGLVLGVKHAFVTLRARRQGADVRGAIDTWETEGGAVPVAPHRTAAQITP